MQEEKTVINCPLKEKKNKTKKRGKNGRLT